jgi:hypothetical protein
MRSHTLNSGLEGAGVVGEGRNKPLHLQSEVGLTQRRHVANMETDAKKERLQAR